MGEEEETQRLSCSSSNSTNNRSSKKVQKQKKIPQRGLGVAQLEKMRLQNTCSNDNFNLEKENSCGLRVIHPFLPLQTTHYNHQSTFDPSLMNVSSRSCSSASSLANLQMELPSNQINPYAVTEEEKMVGMKRSNPYGFGMENPIGPSFHCKLPSIIHPFEIPEESMSFGIKGGFRSTLNPNFRCCDSVISDNWKKIKKENGDFLTLAPPPTTTTIRSPKSKYESFDFSSLPYQGSIEDEIDEAEEGGASLRNELQTFYSFIPPPKKQIAQSNAIPTCDFGEHVIDLNLKL